MALDAGERARVSFCFRAELASGHYTMTIALHSAENHLENCYHWCDNLLQFQVAGVQTHPFAGVCRLPTECETTRGCKMRADSGASVRIKQGS